MMDLLTAIFSASKDFGPAAALILAMLAVNLFFISQSAKRELRQEKRLDEYNARFLPILLECKEAIDKSKDAVIQNSQLITNWLSNVGR